MERSVCTNKKSVAVTLLTEMLVNDDMKYGWSAVANNEAIMPVTQASEVLK